MIDFSVPAEAGGLTQTAVDTAQALFGSCVDGAWLLELLAEVNVRATFAVPPLMARAFPHIVARAASEGHEIAVGGLDKRDVAGLSREEEKRAMLDARAEIERIAGYTPTGWCSLPCTGDEHPGGSLSPHTYSLLAETGFRYFGNGMADDIPYYTATRLTDTPVLSLPYYYSADAQFFMLFPGIGKGSGLVNLYKLRENWNGDLEAARRFGRQTTLFVQPCLMFWGMAKAMLGDALRRFAADPEIWTATAGECAAYWLERYPASETFRPEPGIWSG